MQQIIDSETPIETQAFQWDPNVQAHINHVKIHFLALINGVVSRVQMFPGKGNFETNIHELRLLGRSRLLVSVGADTPKLLDVELVGSYQELDKVIRFTASFRNTNTEAPCGPITGTFGVQVEGPEPFIDSGPAYQISHQVGYHDALFADAMILGETEIGDEQVASLEFFVAFGDTMKVPYVPAKEFLACQILDPIEHQATQDLSPLCEPIVPRDGFIPNNVSAYHELLTTQEDINSGYQYRPGPNWSGWDARFGAHPEKRLIYQAAEDNFGKACAIVKAELLRAHSRYPFHVEHPDGYIAVPDPEAIYTPQGLSEHSRNRLGRPFRPVPPEWYARRGGWDAPATEWVASVVPQLAWYGHDLWAKFETVRLGTRQMTMMHEPIPIHEGGYDCVYLRIMRAFVRGARLLYQSARVASREGWAQGDLFYDHLARVYEWVFEKWRPFNYGIKPRSSSEWVPGHEGELVIPSWQVIHLPVAYCMWRARKCEAAGVVLRDLLQILLQTYVEQPDGEFWMRKIVLADDPTIGWEPVQDLDCLDLWPESSIRLAAELGPNIGLSQEEVSKAQRIMADHSRRYPNLYGGLWIPGISEWGCGSFLDGPQA